MAVCNKDCFNCIYPDCICDSMDMDDIREADARDKEVRPKRRYVRRAEPISATGDRSEYWKVYYQENKDRINARRRERNKENIEKSREYGRRNYAKNKETYKAYYQNNKEKIMEYQREYRRKKREQKRSETP